MTRTIVLLSAAILSFAVGIVGLYQFVRSILIFPEEALKAIAPYEPVHLITGLVLISLGIVLLSFEKKRTKR